MAANEKVVRRKPGRPQIFGERQPLGLRVTNETKERLNAAAHASGRSLSQEAETRLEHTFNAGNAVFDALDLAYGRRWTGLLLALSTLAQIAGTRAVFQSQWKIEACEGWDRDPYAYDQVVRAVTFLLEAFRPEGKIETPVPMDRFGLPASAYHRLGEGFARELLDGLAHPENKGPAWAFADSASGIRERISDLIATMRVPPDAPITMEKTTSPKRG